MRGPARAFPASRGAWRLGAAGPDRSALVEGRRGHGLVSVASRALEAVRDHGNLSVDVPSVRTGNNHPERRRNIILDALLRADGAAPLELKPAAAAPGLGAAELVHGGGFVHFLGSAFERWKTELHGDESYRLPQEDVALVPFHCSKAAFPLAEGLAAEFACFGSDFETPITAGTASALRDDLGVVLEAVDHILQGGQAAYALTVHPGHHAGPSYYSGFCYINNAAVACACLERSGIRPALLDLDFHGGNGSFDIAKKTGIWFRSLHCAGAYPWVDMAERGVELSPGTGWADGYAEALRGALEGVPAEVDVLVVSLGYDTLGTDPEAGKRKGIGLALTAPAFHDMASLLRGTGMPILVVQEGGYDLKHIPIAAAEFARGLSGSRQ